MLGILCAIFALIAFFGSALMFLKMLEKAN
ncbi:Uncharacterised protein [Campylobacter helveticus]|nr:Uncharacterised protein [Campylobacter helveticus]